MSEVEDGMGFSGLVYDSPEEKELERLRAQLAAVTAERDRLLAKLRDREALARWFYGKFQHLRGFEHEPNIYYEYADALLPYLGIEP